LTTIDWLFPRRRRSKGLEQVVLKFEQPVGVAAVHRDVFFPQMALAKLHHSEPREARDDRLGGHEGLQLVSRFDGGYDRDSGIESCFFQNVEGIGSQPRNQLARHRLDKLIRECFAECFPQLGPVRFGVAGWRKDHVVTRRRLTDPRRPIAVVPRDGDR
jgi:hypothetical protein